MVAVHTISRVRALTIGDADDTMAQADGMRCVEALRKRFPTALFQLEHDLRWPAGVWVITTDMVGIPSEDAVESFAEGFMASTHLWER